MAIAIDYGYDTTGVLATTIPAAKYTYPTVFRSKIDIPGKYQMVNASSPMDRPERLEFGFQEIKDVFKGTGVAPGFMPPSLNGRQILLKTTNILSLLDDADTAYRIDLPVSAHLVLRVPSNEYITDTVAVAIIARCLGGLMTASDAYRVADLLKGALKPSGM